MDDSISSLAQDSSQPPFHATPSEHTTDHNAANHVQTKHIYASIIYFLFALKLSPNRPTSPLSAK